MRRENDSLDSIALKMDKFSRVWPLWVQWGQTPNVFNPGNFKAKFCLVTCVILNYHISSAKDKGFPLETLLPILTNQNTKQNKNTK